MIPCGERKSKFFVSVGGAVVKPKIAGVFQAGNFRRRLLSQRLPGSRFQGNGWGVYPPKASALPTALHPVMKFSNCGQTCGQRRFLTSYRRGGKCCQPKCPKAFRDFRELCLEPEPHAPKPPALPTALIPDIRFSA